MNDLQFKISIILNSDGNIITLFNCESSLHDAISDATFNPVEFAKISVSDFSFY